MTFQFLLTFITSVYIANTLFYNNNRSNNFAVPTLISRKSANVSTKEFYKLYRKTRRCVMEKSYNNTSSILFLQLLVLSGDIEVNPGPWTCTRCSQNFRHQAKYDNHIVKQELVSCRYCTKDFCNKRQLHQHQGTCLSRPTSTTIGPGPWTCTRCDQVFKEHSRYDNHIINRELVSFRYCSKHLCNTRQCNRHERTCASRQTTEQTSVAVGPGLWNCIRCSLSFKEQTRYDNHMRNRQFISCRYCERNFCHVNRRFDVNYHVLM